MDFDPRDDPDSRDDERFGPNSQRRGGSDNDRDWDDWRQPEIEEWAREHDLPYFDEQVHFPDARIEYEDADGCWDHVDVEVVTVHYRGAHGSAAARSGFSCYGGSSARVGGGSHLGGLADEFLR